MRPYTIIFLPTCNGEQERLWVLLFLLKRVKDDTRDRDKYICTKMVYFFSLYIRR